MYNEPKGYWSSVFYQTTVLMRQKRGVSPDDAFLMARHIVDENIGNTEAEMPPLPLSFTNPAPMTLAP